MGSPGKITLANTSAMVCRMTTQGNLTILGEPARHSHEQAQ